MSISNFKRQVNLGCPHHTNCNADKATSYPEGSMLTGDFATTEIIPRILRTILTNTECRLHDEVFQNMVTSFADVACDRRPLTSAG